MKVIQSSITKVAKEMGIDEHAIDQRKAFLEFGQDDIARLINIHASLSEYHQEFIDHFYEHILSFEKIRQFLPETINVKQLKKTQLAYFKKLSKGSYEWDYVLDRLQVGLAHQQINLNIEWYIGAYRKYISLLLNYFDSLSGSDCQQSTQAIDSLVKIIFFDMGLAIDTYVFQKNKEIITLKQDLDNLIQGVDGFIWEFDVVRYNYVYVSQQSETMLGYSQNQWVNNPDFQHQIVYPDDKKLMKLAFNNAIFRENNQQIEYRIIIKNGTILWVNERITIVKNDDGEITHLRGLILDINKRKEYEMQLAYMAAYDKLTGLSNRAGFEKQLIVDIAHAKKTGNSTAILFLDLDGFKYINDSLGHAAGDQLLQTIGQRIKDILREQDFAARFGGDEFCLILVDINEDLLLVNITEHLLKILEQPTRISNQDIFPRVSIGIAMYPQDGESSEQLLQCADSAMYAAKEEGKHRFVFYNEEMTLLAAQRLTMENDLRQALIAEEFELYYQPQIEVNSGKLVAVEALIRWHHPIKGMIPPDQFIPVAEKIGLIIPLGQWVLKRACQQIAEWHKSSIKVDRVAVNISSSHFCDSSFSESVKTAIKASGIKACNLELEITEEVVQTNDSILRNFHEIKNLGVSIAVDDFGTGYSCLSSLAQLPIDCLKIDKAFIQKMLTDTNYLTIVATVIAMSRALGFSVVAEGVESRDQVIYLQSVSCSMIQGYYFSKPVTADRIQKLVNRNYFQLEE